MGIKISQKQLPSGMWWLRELKYEETELDRLVANLKNKIES